MVACGLIGGVISSMGLYLEELQGADFRSFPQLQVRFSRGVNVLVGQNAAGKTNALEMVHYLCLTKPARSMPDASSVAHGAESFSLMGLFARDNGEGLPPTPQRVALRYVKNGGKELRFNGQAVARMADHVGRIPLVACFPHSLQLVDDGGELRRRFMNGAIAQYDTGYLLAHARYMDFLGQRNALLRAERFDQGLMEVIEGNLAQVALPLRAARLRYCERLLQPLREYYSQLLPPGQREDVSVRYICSGGEEEDLRVLLMRTRGRDQGVHFTTVGPHRDSMGLFLNGHSLRREGSLGQQKVFILALMLAQAAIIGEEGGMAPILLLDDPFDRLDAVRSRLLLGLLVEGWKGQVFLTHSASLREWGSGGWEEYQVSEGRVVSTGLVGEG